MIYRDKKITTLVILLIVIPLVLSVIILLINRFTDTEKTENSDIEISSLSAGKIITSAQLLPSVSNTAFIESAKVTMKEDGYELVEVFTNDSTGNIDRFLVILRGDDLIYEPSEGLPTYDLSTKGVPDKIIDAVSGGDEYAH